MHIQLSWSRAAAPAEFCPMADTTTSNGALRPGREHQHAPPSSGRYACDRDRGDIGWRQDFRQYLDKEVDRWGTVFRTVKISL
jgi:hypothetical protein